MVAFPWETATRAPQPEWTRIPMAARRIVGPPWDEMPDAGWMRIIVYMRCGVVSKSSGITSCGHEAQRAAPLHRKDGCERLRYCGAGVER